MRKNILLISPSFTNKGGVASVARNYMKHCRSSEFNFFSLASQSHGSVVRKIIFFVTAIFSTIYLLIFHHVDIVHVHGGNIVSLKRKIVFLKLSALFGTKTIYHNHGGNLIADFNDLSPWWKSIIRKQLLKVDQIICLSETLKSQLSETFPGITCQVIPNGVILPEIHRLTPKKSEGTLNLSFMGLIHEKKGIFDLIYITRRLNEDGYKVRLSICGSGEVHLLQETIKNQNLERLVHFHGYLTGERKGKFFQKTDIFILPSYSEAMPIVLLEAMAYALPVVSTHVGAIPELIRNNFNGYLSSPGDLETLYNNIVKLACDPLKRNSFGKEGRALVENHYNQKHLFSKLLDIYDSI